MERTFSVSCLLLRKSVLDGFFQMVIRNGLKRHALNLVSLEDSIAKIASSLALKSKAKKVNKSLFFRSSRRVDSTRLDSLGANKMDHPSKKDRVLTRPEKRKNFC